MVKRKSGRISTMITIEFSPLMYVSLEESKPSSLTILVYAMRNETTWLSNISTFLFK